MLVFLCFHQPVCLQILFSVCWPVLFCCGVLCFQSRLAVATLFCPDSSSRLRVFAPTRHSPVVDKTPQNSVSTLDLWMSVVSNFLSKCLVRSFLLRKTPSETFPTSKTGSSWVFSGVKNVFVLSLGNNEHWFNRNDSDLVCFFQKSNLVMSDIVLKCPLSSLQTRKVTSKTFPASKTDLSTSCSGVKTCSWAENNEYWSGGHL